MKVELLNTPNNKLTATAQVLINRGIPFVECEHYMNTTDADINSPLDFGKEVISNGSKMLMTHIAAEDPALIIVDADCDGYTSAALLINYLYDVFPAFVENNLKWYIHQCKQHGLSDCIDYAKQFKLVICPDSSSNDFEYHTELKKLNIDVLVLDHHEAEKISEDACIINNQLSNYPNKELSGVGVTWQFCRYLDIIGGNNFADEYLDLVALGNMADMMSLKSFETKHLIQKGFEKKNVKNPFIYGMAEKNSYSLGDKITPMGAAFYIAPFINAMVRSGTMEEKNLLFNSMLKFKAFEQILSTKRGHKLGEMERVVDQALRVCINVKNRQTKAQDAGLELLEGLITKENMLDHKVLLFLLEPGQVDRNIAGLIANKFMAKYQRPVCILTKVTNNEGISYQGSARGYDASGFTTFKDLCAAAPGCMYAEGHQGAFGLGLRFCEPGAEDVAGDEILRYLEYTDEALKDMSEEPIYRVDYIWDVSDNIGEKILEIANMDTCWGKDMDEALVCIKGIKVTQDNFKVMKSNTVKITLPNGIDIIKFRATEEEIDKFTTTGWIKINAVCKCAANEWNWEINPQLKLENYEILDKCGWLF